MMPEHAQQQMVNLLKKLAPQEGYNLTALSDVRILRSDRPLARTPVLYDPGIVIVCQGSKQGFFGNRVYLYDEQHYLAVSVPVPFTMETVASAEHPLLAIYMHLDFNVATELLLQLDQQEIPYETKAAQSMMSSLMDEALREVILRFLNAMNHPLDAAILGPSLVREIYYRVLTGPQGSALRAALNLQGHFGKVGRTLSYMHANYVQPLTLSQLAAVAGMSVPTFHTHFKSITHQSPMQYLKSVRLHQARMLMVRQEITASAACYAVGYQSASQFNREFKRLFGLPPAEEIKRMQRNFAVPPAQLASAFVSSH
ncbi:AraC family transcriptional regulator [Candidatus Pantoea multigeneris]|uniref:AraC family transcriptional regulator n=1 Tax=Candidatus Pantoea multigeneris TaxID=2608357 RepID=A0ABX0RCM3_9GAMM|nr:AraC family transcriptional regulator [Pantoea multigeneris]NIF22142.1 AraC family transcriptional regulator [Pantoea multigeneris]